MKELYYIEACSLEVPEGNYPTSEKELYDRFCEIARDTEIDPVDYEIGKTFDYEEAMSGFLEQKPYNHYYDDGTVVAHYFVLCKCDVNEEDYNCECDIRLVGDNHKAIGYNIKAI